MTTLSTTGHSSDADKTKKSASDNSSIKDELKNYATKDDIKNCATIADVQKEHKELRNFALACLAALLTSLGFFTGVAINMINSSTEVRINNLSTTNEIRFNALEKSIQKDMTRMQEEMKEIKDLLSKK